MNELKYGQQWAGRMVQWVRVLAALTENPAPHCELTSTAISTATGNLSPLLASVGTCTRVCKHTHTHSL